MQASDLQLLGSWQNFIMIIGTAAATLTGLMFVATTLIAGIETATATLNAGLSAFNAPTVAHFCVVLLLAGILSAPWPALSSGAVALGLVGFAMMVYLASIMRRMRRVPDRRTPLKDWLWYFIFPLSAYVALIAAALALLANPELALYLVSAVMLVLLFLGIHNTWDLVTYLAVERSHSEIKSGEKRHRGSSR